MSSDKKRKSEDEPKPGSSKKIPAKVDSDDDDDFVGKSSPLNAMILSDDEDEEMDDVDPNESKVSPWKCVPCNKGYKSERSLASHKSTYHSGKKNKFPCTYPGCKKVLTTQRVLVQHLENVHEKGEFPCDECNEYVGETKKALRKHKVKHNKQEMPFKCPFCDCAYSTEHQCMNHVTNTKHPQLSHLVPTSNSDFLVGSQSSQPLSDVGPDDEEIKSYNLRTGSKASIPKGAVAVLVMTIWKKDLMKLKTAVTVQCTVDAPDYTRMKAEVASIGGKNHQHLTDDSSSFFITGEDADESANLCLTVIKITQLMLDLKFQFNQFVKLNLLDIKNWNSTFFKNFLLSNNIKVDLESIEDYTERKGVADNFSMYYRDRDWICKAPEKHAGHIYIAYFKFREELFLYIGINESLATGRDVLAACHKRGTDTTALGQFIREQKEKYPNIKIDVKGKLLVECARISTRRQLESVCILSALLGSEEDIFLDADHHGKFKLLNKKVDIEEITKPFLQTTRYITYKLFKKRLNIIHDGEYTLHVSTSCVDESFENVKRMPLVK